MALFTWSAGNAMDLFSAQHAAPADGEVIPLADAEVRFYPAFFSPAAADEYFARLHSGLAWQQDTIVLYGKASPVPRLNAWYGDAGLHYTYSGIRLDPLPWLPVLDEIRARVQAVCGNVAFNSVLANLYRDGRDSVAWHSDDERELGNNPVIASVTFGAARTFQWRRRDNPQQRAEQVLPHGSLLLMQGTTQRYWQHQIPKSARVQAPRINLTFRVVKPVAGTGRH